MSPVPPAMSRIFHPCWSSSDDDDDDNRFAPGSRERTKWSFHNRWMPRDIRSFMVSYDEATEEKTAPTFRIVSFGLSRRHMSTCLWLPFETRPHSEIQSGWYARSCLVEGSGPVVVRRRNNDKAVVVRRWRTSRYVDGAGYFELIEQPLLS